MVSKAMFLFSKEPERVNGGCHGCYFNTGKSPGSAKGEDCSVGEVLDCGGGYIFVLEDIWEVDDE
jgi:hypothetical protein